MRSVLILLVSEPCLPLYGPSHLNKWHDRIVHIADGEDAEKQGHLCPFG